MDLIERFLEEIKQFLLLKGFIQGDNRFSFICKSDLVIRTLTLDIDSSARTRFNIKPQLLIRNNEISNLRKGFANIPHKGDYYYTVITQQHSLAELYKKAEFKTLGYIILDEMTLKSSIANFKNFMNEIGFPFFDRFNSLDDFDKWFNESVLIEELDFRRINVINWAVEGLIAAKLNHNPNYEKIYQIWIKKLTEDGRYNKTIENLKSLNDYLDSI